jgi:hypothetical protein
MHNIHVHCTLYMIPVYDYQLHASVSVGPVSMNVRPPVYDEFSVFEVIKSRDGGRQGPEDGLVPSYFRYFVTSMMEVQFDQSNVDISTDPTTAKNYDSVADEARMETIRRLLQAALSKSLRLHQSVCFPLVA